ncbi:MAG: ExeM/NucH family extracellular endonuclease, partial [Woeseiaceae bacterium]|nr:ExeM/NucH family extracellular endonuclease [Woeseiaceae bacterium]
MKGRSIFFSLPVAVLLAACLEDSPAGSSSGAVVPIAAVQGDGPMSPFVGRRVSIRGIVSGDFQDGDDDESGNLGGFFVQSASDTEPPAGLFVYDGRNSRIDVRAGDVVVVAGTVQEHFGETQLAADDVEIVGRGEIRAIALELPVNAVTLNDDGDPIADLERYEGQLVRIPGPLVVTDLYELERFGAVRLAADDRLYQFTNANAPDVEGYEAHRRRNAMRSILLDDGQREGNVAPIRYLWGGAGPNGALRVGDTLQAVAGALRYSRGSGADGAEGWRLMPVAEPEFEAANPRPGKPVVGGTVRVASFNVLNYFSTIDGDDAVCGPDRDPCRGADSRDEQQRQLAKIVSAIAMAEADVVGLVELENNPAQSLDDIVGALNDRLGEDRYRAVRTGTIGRGPIKTGFIYDQTAVLPEGSFALLDQTVDVQFRDGRNRPALAQTFKTVAGGRQLTVIVNHLKSKGSPCDDEGDVNAGDGQGNCNGVRTAAAAALAEWAGNDPTGSGDPDVLIIGDLNAYLAEDPLRALEGGGFVNLLTLADGVPAYSFVYDGQSGALDHAL